MCTNPLPDKVRFTLRPEPTAYVRIDPTLLPSSSPSPSLSKKESRESRQHSRARDSQFPRTSRLPRVSSSPSRLRLICSPAADQPAESHINPPPVMKGSPTKPPRYPSARYNQSSAPPLSPPQSRGGEDSIPPMPPMPAFPANLSGRTIDEPPSYMDDQMLLPPLAVPLGYGSGSPPPPYASAVPAMPVYRQQYQPTSPYRTSPPPLDVNTQTPPAVYFQYNANTSASPPQAFDMHRPRGSHRAYHQMYRQQSPQNQQQQRTPSKCSSVWYFLKLLVFNAANGFLGIAGFTVVSAGLTLALVTLPLCCFGIVLFRVLLRVVYVGCKIDAVLHNLIASSDEKIQFGARHHYHHHLGHVSSLGERRSLLPTQIDWQLQPHHHQQDEDQLPQFEKTLGEVSPRTVLATIYFGSIKFLVGIFSLIAIGLVAFVIAFFIDGDSLQLKFNDDENVQEEDPFTVYMFAIGLAVFSVAMLFANARISQAITRFFCCEGGV